MTHALLTLLGRLLRRRVRYVWRDGAWRSSLGPRFEAQYERGWRRP